MGRAGGLMRRYGVAVTRDDAHRPATPTARAARVRRATLTLGTVALVAASLTACNKMSPQQTDVGYAPADGIEVDLGQVKVRDLLVVSSGEGKAGAVNGLLVNQGTQPAQVSFALGESGAPVTATVDPGQALNLASQQVTLPSVPAKPGAMVNLQVGTSTTGMQNPLVPVLPPTGYYATVTPTASASASSATTTPTATATSSESATAPAPSTPAATASPTTTTTQG